MEDAERTLFSACIAVVVGALLILLFAWNYRRTGPPYKQKARTRVPALSNFAQPPMDSKGCLIEQLVPEVTYYLLSFLDHQSLCSVSMTSVAMRRLANDDRVWKHLFHLDFTSEQDQLQPPGGWKGHYSLTKAVLETNHKFYHHFMNKSVRGMAGLWLKADYVKCIHPGGMLMSGYDAIVDSWRVVFGWGQRYEFELRDVKCRVVEGMAWVTLKEFVNQSVDPLIATNCFEKHDGLWHIVHHHSSPQFAAAGPDWGQFG